MTPVWFYVLFGVLYIVTNIILTLGFLSQEARNKKEHTIIVVVGTLFGLPLFIIIAITTVIGVMVEMSRENKEDK